MAINSVPSKDFRHVEWIQFEDGRMHECAVIRKHPSGMWLIIPINNLDDVDRRRLTGMLADRQAGNLELWDIMSQRTLNNGINALVYFHQLTKMVTSDGRITDPQTGVAGGVVPGVSGVQPVPAK